MGKLKFMVVLEFCKDIFDKENNVRDVVEKLWHIDINDGDEIIKDVESIVNIMFTENYRKSLTDDPEHNSWDDENWLMWFIYETNFGRTSRKISIPDKTVSKPLFDDIPLTKEYVIDSVKSFVAFCENELKK